MKRNHGSKKCLDLLKKEVQQFNIVALIFLWRYIKMLHSWCQFHLNTPHYSFTLLNFFVYKKNKHFVTCHAISITPPPPFSSKSPLVASYYGSSDQHWATLHTTSILANALLILVHGPISTCVWFGTTVSVMVRLFLRGQEGTFASLLSGRKHTDNKWVGWRQMWSERRDGLLVCREQESSH